VCLSTTRSGARSVGATQGRTPPLKGCLLAVAASRPDYTYASSNDGWLDTAVNADAALSYGRLIADGSDGKVIWAPIIEAANFPDSGEVSGIFNQESADVLSAELNSGALPVDAERVPTSR
jgi:preprotein translocase subunit SecD